MSTQPRPTSQRHYLDGPPEGRDLLEIQRQTQSVVDQIYARAPWLSGQLLSSELDASGHKLDGIVLSAGVAKSIAHKLGKKYRGGWVVRDFGTNASNIRETASDDKSVTLSSSVSCKIYFWAWG